MKPLTSFQILQGGDFPTPAFKAPAVRVSPFTRFFLIFNYFDKTKKNVIIAIMLKAIIEELAKIKPCYSLESFNATEAVLTPCFFVVDIEEKQQVGRFSHHPLFVYVYAPSEAFGILRELKKEAINVLHKHKFEKKESEGFFFVEYVKEVFMKMDKTLNKRCICLEFRLPAI